MLDFRYQNQTEIIFGRGTEKQIGEEVAKYGKKIMLCSYGQEFERHLLQTIKKSLDAQGIEYVELTGIKPNPEETKVYEGIEIVKKKGIEFILAVGGGSVIDTAKSIGMGAMYDGDFWDFFTGKSVQNTLPTGVILTFPATGSETSTGVVISNQKTGYKLGVDAGCIRPKFAIFNPELTFTLPPFQTFCGVVDMMAHAMERYFTNTKNTDLTDRLGEGVIKTIIRNAKILQENPEDYNARAEIMLSSTLAHNGLVGMGREEDWGSHDIGMEISAIYDSTHGATLSVIFPAWAKYVYKDNIPRFVQFAMRIFDVEYDIDNAERTALEGIERMKQFFKSLNVPTTMKELGIDTDDRYMEMANKACENGPRGGLKKLHPKDIYNILKLAE